MRGGGIYCFYSESIEAIAVNSNLKGSLILILTAFIWGMAFVAQSSATGYVGTFTFVFVRSLITCIVLFIGYRALTKPEERARAAAMKKTYLTRGALIGAILFAASAFQQAGIAHTTAAKSGFVTALYIVMIPIIDIFLGQKPGKKVWLGVIVALVGLCLLCLKDDLTVNVGDLLTLVCALLFSLHIITIDRTCGGLNSVLVSAIQFGAGALCALPLMLIFEHPQLENILACWTSIAYAAVFSGALGYTLQIVGQKYAEPTLASLLMCLESVFAALGGWVLLGEALSMREFLGCALMLSASVIAQLPERKLSN